MRSQEYEVVNLSFGRPDIWSNIVIIDILNGAVNVKGLCEVKFLMIFVFDYADISVGNKTRI